MLQLQEFAEAKQLSGWQPQYLIWDERVALIALERKIFGLGALWYIPKGPGIVEVNDLHKFTHDLRDYAKQNGIFLVRIEPEILIGAENLDRVIEITDLKKTLDIQARSTVIVDLTPDEEEIFKTFPQPGRYAVNRAKRDEGYVEAVDTTEETIDIAYRMLADTAAAGNFRIRPRDYYETFWKNFSDHGLGQMFFLKHEDRVIAIAYVIVLGEKASYKDGASVKDRPVYGGSNLLQWEAMRWAKSRGATSYDLTGTPPSSEQKNKDHPLFGLVKFKTSFNKTITDFIGVYDLEVQPKKVQIWHKIGYRVARRLHNRKRNEVYW